MQQEYLGDGLDEARGPRPTNFDFNINRCKTEKLQEQMTVEKAICVLKIPQTRSNASVLDRRLLEDCFMGQQVDKRARVNPEDPDYKKKIENRHVLDRE